MSKENAGSKEKKPCSALRPCFLENCADCLQKALSSTPLKRFQELDDIGVRFNAIVLSHAKRTHEYKNYKLPASSCNWCWNCAGCFKHIASSKNKHIPFLALDYYRTTGAPAIPLSSRKTPTIAGFADWYHPQYRPTEDEMNLVFYIAAHDTDDYIGYATLLQDVVCLDFDTAAGAETASKWFPEYPGRTATGKGAHYFFKHSWALGSFPVAHIIGTNINHAGLKSETVDIKTYRSYCVGPGSYHTKGRKRYQTGVSNKPWWRCELSLIDESMLVERDEQNRKNADGETTGKVAALVTKSIAAILKDGVETREVQKKAATAPRVLPVVQNSDKITKRAKTYLSRCDGAVSGKGGNNKTFRIACVLVNDFALDANTALSLMSEWNERCDPPWEIHELEAKIQDAINKADPTKYGSKTKEKEYPYLPILPPDKPTKKKKNPASSRVDFPPVEKKIKPEAPLDSAQPKSKLEPACVDDFEFGGIDKAPSADLIYFLERKAKEEVEFTDVPKEVLGESEDAEESEDTDEELEDTEKVAAPCMREPGEEADLPDNRPRPPRVRFKTQQRMRLYGYNVLRAKWEKRIAENEDKNQKEKDKEIKRCNGFSTTWNKITNCAQCSWRREGSLGTKKNIPLFCERTALCIKCVEYNRKMCKLWTETEWKDGFYTLIEKRGEFVSHSHRDVDYERKLILKEIIKPSGAKDMKQRYFEGYAKNVYIGEDDMYFAIRKLKAPKRESDLLGLDFHIGSWTTVKRLTKAEVIDYLFGDNGFWSEPAKAFFKINMQLDKAIFDGDDEKIQLKYMNQLAEFPFMEGWHKKRTNGNKSGKALFPLPDKKAINAICKAERLKKHPEEADSKETFDNGALYWFKRKVVDVPKTLEKEWEKAKFIKDAHASATIFMCKPDSTLNKLWGHADKLKAEAAQAKAEGKLFLFPAGFAAAG